MAFFAEDEWEENTYFRDESTTTRYYGLVEVSIATHQYFIVDAQRLDDDGEPTRYSKRCFFTQILDALNFIRSSNNPTACLLHNQLAIVQDTKTSESDDFQSSIIERIALCKDVRGNSALKYELKNGKQVMDFLRVVTFLDDEDCNCLESIYEEKKLTRIGRNFLDKK